MVAKVGIKDVAEMAAVDVSTVSRILNRSFAGHKYSERTVKKVRDSAGRLGYRPHQAAKTLRTGKTMLLGMVVPDIANPFFAELASHVEHLAWRNGYRVVICSTDEDAERQTIQIADLASRGIDGLIISPAIGGRIRGAVASVAIDRPADESGIPCVRLDNHKAGYLLGEHLAGMGYQSIGIVLPESKFDPTIQHRLEGVLEGLGNLDFVKWQLEIPFSSAMVKDVRRETIKRLRMKAGPGAIVGLTNWCTLGILEALSELEIQWGSEIGLAGIDDFAGADLMKPGITVVAQPIKELADKAFARLLGLMSASDKKQTKNQACLLEPVLVVRNSLPRKIGD